MKHLLRALHTYVFGAFDARPTNPFIFYDKRNLKQPSLMKRKLLPYRRLIYVSGVWANRSTKQDPQTFAIVYSLIKNGNLILTLPKLATLVSYFWKLTFRFYRFTIGEGFIYIRGLFIIFFADALIADDEPLWEPVEWSLVQSWILFIFLFAWIAENLISSRYGNYTGRDKRV